MMMIIKVDGTGGNNERNRGFIPLWKVKSV